MSNLSIPSIVAIVAAGALSFEVAGQTQMELTGTWVIDPKETEKHLIKMGPPSRNVEWLPSIILRLCVTTMTFEPNALIVDQIGPASMERSLRLEPQQEGKTTYTIQTDDGRKDTLVVSFLNEQNITISFEKVGLDAYVVWKRGKKPNRQTAQEDFKQAFDTCTSVLKNVPYIKAGGR